MVSNFCFTPAIWCCLFPIDFWNIKLSCNKSSTLTLIVFSERCYDEWWACMYAFTGLDDERCFVHNIKIDEYCQATLYHSKIVSTTKKYVHYNLPLKRKMFTGSYSYFYLVRLYFLFWFGNIAKLLICILDASHLDSNNNITTLLDWVSHPWPFVSHIPFCPLKYDDDVDKNKQ